MGGIITGSSLKTFVSNALEAQTHTIPICYLLSITDIKMHVIEACGDRDTYENGEQRDEFIVLFVELGIK